MAIQAVALRGLKVEDSVTELRLPVARGRRKIQRS